MNIAHPALDGLLVVDKPGRADLTPAPIEEARPALGEKRPYRGLLSSHDVVARVRRWSGQKRIGHTGTLDPLASGVLVLCLGSATRLVEYYQNHPKRYEAVITLGAETDSYDAEGHLVAHYPVPPLTAAAIDQALAPLRGVVEQQAPRFSAIKQEGKALYSLARRGKEVDAPTRTVTFTRIDLIEFIPPARVTLAIDCSAGAYIRSLAHDLGAALGTGAYLQALRRTAAGDFTLADAHPLEHIEAAARTGRLHELLLPTGDRLPLPDYRFDADILQRLRHGQTVILPDAACEPSRQLAAARDENGVLVGVIRRLGVAREGAGWRWRAQKWLQ
ncbi:MAG TPA: tRNA pseudouridine(55) synthase TruB [Chloroflexi bacterium]|nr:tRNA pseudouridine(55) synthase TruB [Chloroflexota bacterium]